MKDYKKNLGKKIKEKRKELGLTQAGLAEKLGVECKYLSRLETGASTPSFAMLEKLSFVLGTDLAEFFIIDDTATKNAILKKINSRLTDASVESLNIIFKLINGVLN